MGKKDLIGYLNREGFVKYIIDAFIKVDRKNFVPEKYKKYAFAIIEQGEKKADQQDQIDNPQEDAASVRKRAELPGQGACGQHHDAGRANRAAEAHALVEDRERPGPVDGAGRQRQANPQADMAHDGIKLIEHKFWPPARLTEVTQRQA